MDRSYLVQVTAGAYAWTVTDLDAPDYGLTDPLTVGWSIPDTEHRPSQPDTMVATFGVIVPTSADLDLVLGDPVTIEVTFGPADKTIPDVVFLGRVAQGEAVAHSRGVLYRFTCADATTDLNGYDIGADPYLVQTITTRMSSYLSRAGVPDTDVIRGPVVSAVDANLSVEQIEQPSAQDLLTATIELWDQVAMAGAGALAPVRYRAIIAPYPGPSSTGLPYRWSLDALSDAYVPTAQAPLPGRFGHWFPDPQGWGILLDPDDRASGVIDSCYVEQESPWAAISPAVVNRAAVTWLVANGADPAVTGNERTQRVTYNNENPAPAGQTPTTAARETQTIGIIGQPSTPAAQNNATRLGALMVPPPQNPGGWAPDTFRWFLYADHVGQAEFPVIFPRHDATDQPTPRALRTACYARPITIVGIPGRWNPADATRDWVAGQLANVTLTIQDGRSFIDFQLVPTIPAAGNPDTAVNSWDATPGTWDAQTGVWNDLEPGLNAFRWNDTGLAGVTWDQIHPQSWDMYRLVRGN